MRPRPHIARPRATNEILRRTNSCRDGRRCKPKDATCQDAELHPPTISDATTGCTPDTWTATSITNVPEARYYHTAVWTGSEMIVWGGDNFFRERSGGRYNPSTDSWTATNTTSAPSARTDHTAVWTGNEMIIWGGVHLNGSSNTGGRYNPSHRQLDSHQHTNAPSCSKLHTAVWTGSEMIVWGGSTTATILTRAVDTIPSRIAGQPPAPPTRLFARYGHTAVWTGNEMIVWGGCPGHG